MRQCKTRCAALLLFFFLTVAQNSVAEERVESDVVYGMLSGLALTMDVHSPDAPNGRGVVLIPGSAWDGRTLDYTDWQVKSGYRHINQVRDALVRGGFVVFVPNHRMAPKHRFPAAIEDARRAVRFIRHNSSRYGIDPRSLGAVGHSSGGYLCALLGVLEDDARSTDGADPISQQSSRVQAVVSIDAPYDLSRASAFIMPFVVAYMGERPPMDTGWRQYLLEGRYADASPIAHVSRNDAAFMLVHAINDPNVQSRQAEMMSDALEKAGLEVETLLVPGDTHTPQLDHGRIVTWLKRQLE